mgnify:CR=1 FL=1|jgi:hypothetical protein
MLRTLVDEVPTQVTEAEDIEAGVAGIRKRVFGQRNERRGVHETISLHGAGWRGLRRAPPCNPSSIRAVPCPHPGVHARTPARAHTASALVLAILPGDETTGRRGRASMRIVRRRREHAHIDIAGLRCGSACVEKRHGAIARSLPHARKFPLRRDQLNQRRSRRFQAPAMQTERAGRLDRRRQHARLVVADDLRHAADAEAEDGTTARHRLKRHQRHRLRARGLRENVGGPVDVFAAAGDVLHDQRGLREQ